MSTFEIVRGVEGDCLVLDDTRICGPKPWGGGRIIKTFRTDGIYEVIDKDEHRKLMAENAKLREAIAKAVHVQTVLCADKDAPWCRNECQLHRAESDDCEACDVLEVVQELGIEVG